jgi:hypothetical protein
MGGITQEGKLYLTVQEPAYQGADVVGFLKHLEGHVAGKLLVIWGGAPIHRNRVVKEYLSKGLSGIIRYVASMRTLLSESSLAERKSFIKSFVKEIVIDDWKAVLHYTIPALPVAP